MIAIVVGGIGVVVGAVAVVGSHFTRIVTDAHAATLHATANRLIESLSFGNASNYGVDGHRPRDAFRVHFRRLAEALDRWDEVRNAEDADRHAVHARVNTLASEHRLASPTFETAEIISHASALLTNWAREGRRGDPTSLDWTYYMSSNHRTGLATPILNKTWVTLDPFEGESDEDWTTRAKVATDMVDQFYAAAQALPAIDAWATSVLGVREFSREELPSLLDALRLVLEIEHPPRARRCPTC